MFSGLSLIEDEVLQISGEEDEDDDISLEEEEEEEEDKRQEGFSALIQLSLVVTWLFLSSKLFILLIERPSSVFSFIGAIQKGKRGETGKRQEKRRMELVTQSIQLSNYL